MLGHVLLGTLLIVIDNSLNKKTMLFIHFKFRTVFLHNIISGSRNYIFNQLIRCSKHTVDHRIVCNLCNLRMQFFIQFSSGLLIFRFIYTRKYPPQFCRIQWCALSRSQNCHLSSSAALSCCVCRIYPLFSLNSIDNGPISQESRSSAI